MGGAEQGRWHRLDLFDLGVLLALIVVAFWLFGVLGWHALGSNATWIGADGLGPLDSAQYLAWVRSASEQVLIANPFVLEPTSAVFLHPGLALSGAIAALGVDPAIAYLLWKPLAIAVLFVGVRAYVRRTVTDAWPRRGALLLSLFYLAPAAMLAHEVFGADYFDQLALDSIAHDLWAGFWLWGLPFTAIAVALVPATLLAYERARGSDARTFWPAVMAAVCAWFQPWQGATLIAIIVGTEILTWRRQDRLPASSRRLLLITVTGAALPLAYYGALGKLDDSWRLAGEANLSDGFQVWTLAACLVPIAIPALLAYRLPAADFQAVALRVWPVAAVAQYGFIQVVRVGTFPLHALDGIAIPLGILAVIGVRRTFPRAWSRRTSVALVTALVVLVTVPSTVWQLRESRAFVLSDEAATPFFLKPGERRALDYLDDDPRLGGVLSPIYLGVLVPARTGRRTWVGSLSWTPNFFDRVKAADDIFFGRIDPDETRAIVERSGAKFLLADCRGTTDLSVALRPILDSVRYFGCATVYILR